MNNFKQYIRRLTSCEDVTTRKIREFMENGGIHRVLVIGENAKMYSCGRLHVKNVRWVLLKQVEV